MNWREEAIVFECAGETLVGVLALPEASARVGVLVVVGGPQYRAGSHRQFVVLSRHLAASGVPVMRFDYRGMGDSTGAARDFRAVDEDIEAAVSAFANQVPGLEQVVLWGLCDGASAACFHAPKNPRVAGLVLVNPWVRTEAGQAETYLKHYYSKRLTDLRFWKKLVRGNVDIMGSLRSLVATAAKAGGGRARQAGRALPVRDLPDRMAHDLDRSGVPFAVVLSGRDYVAREFEQVARERPAWRRLLNGTRAHTVGFTTADHTFSSGERRDALSRATWDWLVRTGLAPVSEDGLQRWRPSHESVDQAG